MESKFKKNLKYYLISAIVALILAIGFFCLFFFVRGQRIGYDLINWLDSLMLSGIVIGGIGGLMGVAHEGFFDFVSYGFKQLGSSIFSKSAHTYNDYPGYIAEKKDKRKSSPKIFVSVLIVAGLLLLASLCLYLVYKSK